MRVQAFCPEATVESFDVGVVCWLSRPREVERDALRVGPQVKVSGDELGPLPRSSTPKPAGGGLGHGEAQGVSGTAFPDVAAVPHVDVLTSTMLREDTSYNLFRKLRWPETDQGQTSTLPHLATTAPPQLRQVPLSFG